MTRILSFASFLLTLLGCSRPATESAPPAQQTQTTQTPQASKEQRVYDAYAKHKSEWEPCAKLMREQQELISKMRAASTNQTGSEQAWRARLKKAEDAVDKNQEAVRECRAIFESAIKAELDALGASDQELQAGWARFRRETIGI